MAKFYLDLALGYKSVLRASFSHVLRGELLSRTNHVHFVVVLRIGPKSSWEKFFEQGSRSSSVIPQNEAVKLV